MKRLISILLLAVLSGCVTLKAEHVITGTPRAPFAGEVKVVMENAPLTGEYEEVAILNSAGVGQDSTLPSVIKALQAEAASLGCNAVIRVRFDQGLTQASATGVAVFMK